MRRHLPERRLAYTQTFQRDGITITMSVGFYHDNSVGELFINADRGDSMIDALLSDAAIILSLALQHGAPLQTIAHALKRDPRGVASSPIGAAVDRITMPEAVE
jgi:hypothetical protein